MLVGILILSLSGCSTTGGVSERRGDVSALMLLDLSRYPSDVYVGISGPYSTQERMVEQAILSCARSILLERSLALDNTLVMQSSSDKGLVSFAQKEKAFYDDTMLTEVISDLEVLSVTFDEQAGSVVLARYPKALRTRRSYTSTKGSDGKPDWLLKLPQVDGYRFGIGSSKAYYFLNDSLEASDFSAAQNLLDLNTEHAFSTSIDTSSTSRMEHVLYQAQRGLLLGFTIVDRYYDTENDTYWSLASITE